MAFATLLPGLDIQSRCGVQYGSIIAVIYYSSWCHPHLQAFYIGTASVLGIPIICLCLTEWYLDDAQRNFRVVAFISFGEA